MRGRRPRSDVVPFRDRVRTIAIHAHRCGRRRRGRAAGSGSHRPGRSAPHLRPDRRTVQPPRGVPAFPRARRTYRAATLDGHEVGQDLLGIYAYNGNEYLEGMLGAFRARVAPFNVNYRYVKNELQYLLADSGRRRACLPRDVRAARRRDPARTARSAGADPDRRRLGQRPARTAPSTTRRSLASGAPRAATGRPSPDDLYVLYTGGTTGMPKGVLWRQHDIFMAALGGRNCQHRRDRPRPTRRSPSGVAENPGAKMFTAAAADARRRAVGRHDRAHHRPDGRAPATNAQFDADESCARSSGRRS